MSGTLSSGQEFSIKDEEFATLSKLIYEQLGIVIAENKRVLLQSRLQKVLRDHQLRDFGQYIRALENDKGGASLAELANAISTNHTFFYREPQHFQIFSERVLPEAVEYRRAAKSNDLRIWCAAAATGEEPYLLAMLLQEHFKEAYPQWRAGLLATDISQQALDTCKKGIYEYGRLDKLPKLLLEKYFDKAGSESYKVQERLIREITFRRLNLINFPYPLKGHFDAIFCRNVLIYFDQATRARVVENLCLQLRMGGYLFLGLSETMPVGVGGFKAISPSAYVRVS